MQVKNTSPNASVTEKIKDLIKYIESTNRNVILLGEYTIVVIDERKGEVNIRNYYLDDSCISTYCSLKEFKEKIGGLINGKC